RLPNPIRRSRKLLDGEQGTHRTGMRRIEIVAPRLERIAGGLDLRAHAAPPRWRRREGVPDTGRNVLMMPMRALGAPRQRKPLESHDLDTTARVHHAARRGGGGIAARGVGAATGDAGDRIPKLALSRGFRTPHPRVRRWLRRGSESCHRVPLGRAAAVQIQGIPAGYLVAVKMRPMTSPPVSTIIVIILRAGAGPL